MGLLLPLATASSPRPILTPVPRILSPDRLDRWWCSFSVFRITADVVIRFLKVSVNIRIIMKSVYLEDPTNIYYLASPAVCQLLLYTTNMTRTLPLVANTIVYLFLSSVTFPRSYWRDRGSCVKILRNPFCTLFSLFLLSFSLSFSFFIHTRLLKELIHKKKNIDWDSSRERKVRK